MAMVIQRLLLIKNQNISANSKNRNSETCLPKNSKKRFIYKICKYCNVQVIHKGYFIFFYSVPTPDYFIVR